jgi:hypothetical protein
VTSGRVSLDGQRLVLAGLADLIPNFFHLVRVPDQRLAVLPSKILDL